jgi:hypothetical protein
MEWRLPAFDDIKAAGVNNGHRDHRFPDYFPFGDRQSGCGTQKSGLVAPEHAIQVERRAD